jgi:hypothetical protein
MEEEKAEQKARRPYHKPQLEQVQLVAEEAVLAACKRGRDCMTDETPPKKTVTMGT